MTARNFAESPFALHLGALIGVGIALCGVGLALQLWDRRVCAFANTTHQEES